MARKTYDSLEEARAGLEAALEDLRDPKFLVWLTTAARETFEAQIQKGELDLVRHEKYGRQVEVEKTRRGLADAATAHALAVEFEAFASVLAAEAFSRSVVAVLRPPVRVIDVTAPKVSRTKRPKPQQ